MLRMLLFALSLMPLLYGVFVIASTSVLDPVQYLQRLTGQWALNFLLITLSVTPLRKILAWSELARCRRQLGLTCFFYACLHFVSYVVFERNLDLADISFDISKRPAVLIGLVVFIALTPLAATSSNAMQKYLGGRRWKQLHRMIYPASLLATLHYFLITKVDLTRPILYISMAVFLLLWRIYDYRRRK
jgi:methionine sulfoxide reductase heme-binding subunit